VNDLYALFDSSYLKRGMFAGRKKEEFIGKSEWGPLFRKKYFFFCKNGKFTRGGVFRLHVTSKKLMFSPIKDKKFRGKNLNTRLMAKKA